MLVALLAAVMAVFTASCRHGRLGVPSSTVPGKAVRSQQPKLWCYVPGDSAVCPVLVETKESLEAVCVCRESEQVSECVREREVCESLCEIECV